MDIFVAVVDGSIDAQLTGQPVALLLASRDADNSTAFDFTHLANDGSNSTGCRRHNECVTGFWLAVIVDAEIGGHAG